MADIVLTDSDVARDVRSYYNRIFIESARAFLIHRQMGQLTRLPSKNSLTVRWRKVAPLAKATTPLTESVTPTGSPFTLSEISETVKQYGDYVTYSDVVDLAGEDPILAKITEEQSEQMAETLDTLTRDVLVAGTNVSYANGAARASVNTIISKGDIDTVVRFLRAQKAKPVKDRIVSGRNITTEGIDPAYFAIIHQDTIPTIEGMTGFVPVAKYANPKLIMENEIGTVNRVRFVWTSEGKVFLGAGAASGANVKETGTKADVYASLFIAKDAYGIIGLEEGSMDIIAKKLGSSGAGDPLNQRGTLGWKVWDATKILTQGFLIRVEHAVTDAL